ncbi:SCO3374 family protein [Streptomyces poonensis]|uniref:Proline-rich protein n=1 Tax=Streptomyces poonensis TaxID=68255 RepID=A0A918UJH4_9ACTN|nr:SCO3374 family protein [Streptomyces poonensis]GGZ14410.1 hypothetical protein GCM10010365_37930 [Streptomyces poonensis]GLJ93288.1 hypothetical protein GCM10017589_59000 [Streptomyces poonensis]
MALIVPLPRCSPGPGDGVRRWYEDGLGWSTVPGSPVRLMTGLRFDVLDVPAEAGVVALRRVPPRTGPGAGAGSPVALHGGRMRFLVAAGSAEELPGLLEWLDWGGLELNLAVLGAGGRMEAPLPWRGGGGRDASLPGGGAGIPVPGRPSPPVRSGPREAAVWLRPPEPGCEVEASLPALSAPAGGGGTPDLVRLVDTVANECHRVRLRRMCAQPLAFSYASRMDAGTRPRSLTS